MRRIITSSEGSCGVNIETPSTATRMSLRCTSLISAAPAMHTHRTAVNPLLACLTHSYARHPEAWGNLTPQHVPPRMVVCRTPDLPPDSIAITRCGVSQLNSKPSPSRLPPPPQFAGGVTGVTGAPGSAPCPARAPRQPSPAPLISRLLTSLLGQGELAVSQTRGELSRANGVDIDSPTNARCLPPVGPSTASAPSLCEVRHES